MTREREEILEEVVDKLLDLLDQYQVTNKECLAICDAISKNAKEFIKKGVDPYAE